jgi:hypothetical protein
VSLIYGRGRVTISQQARLQLEPRSGKIFLDAIDHEGGSHAR